MAYNCKGLIFQLNFDILAKAASGIHDCEIIDIWYR
jgi:hypothetical protein